MNIGCDPEFFFRKDGKIIGSEQVLPKDGWHWIDRSWSIVRDGVQAEIHPCFANTCLGNWGSSWFGMMGAFGAWLRRKHPGVECVFHPSTLTLSDEEFASLSPESRKLGCMPSKNVYDSGATISVPADYPVRSGGGHIHFGVSLNGPPEPYVVMLDVYLGTLGVLMDRDPRAAERRTVYGRAGEFRTPKHGLEYRTLSNFWMRAWPIGSLLFQVGRAVINSINYSSWNAQAGRYISGPESALYQSTVSAISIDRVREAINTNNFEMALENWGKIKELMRSGVDWMHNLRSVIGGEYTSYLDHFIAKGLDHWWPVDGVLARWASHDNGHRGGQWFLAGAVKTDMMKEKAA